MGMSAKLPKYFVLAAFAGGLGLIAYQNFVPSKKAGKSSKIEVLVPQLSAVALQGQQAFDAKCAQCHGQNASGTDKGPPLVHDIYNPGHHADESFYRAVKLGTRQHHWPYGDMPPQPEVSKGQVATILKYVRELQVANGITYKPHRM